MKSTRWLIFCLSLVISTSAFAQQTMPADYSAVLNTLGRQGDFKDGVLKVNIPRNDLKVVIDGIESPGTITTSFPLVIRQFDNSFGFLDFIYPQFDSKVFEEWVNNWVNKTWTDGVNYLTSINQTGMSERLVHRSSGWIEILDASEDYISGIATYINPGGTRRESFVWLKKEDVILPSSELVNTVADYNKASTLALQSSDMTADEEYKLWLQNAGYKYLVPSREGIVMLTEFNMIYGDDIHLILQDESKELIKKKYWRNFGWQ